MSTHSRPSTTWSLRPRCDTFTCPKAKWRLGAIGVQFDRKAVVVCCYFDSPSLFVDYRLIDASVAKLELVGVETQRPSKQLISETYSKKRLSL